MAYQRKARGSNRGRSRNAGRGGVRRTTKRGKARSGSFSKSRSRSGGQTVRLVIESAPVAAPISAQEMLTPTQQVAARTRRF